MRLINRFNIVPLRQNNIINMAIYIKPIPTLTGKVAEAFEKNARANEAKQRTVDFSQEVEMTKRILEKSNLRRFK